MIVTWIGLTVAAEKNLSVITTGREETERVKEKSFTADEVIPEEALMSYHMVTRDPAAEADVGELIVMSRVQEVQG
jgi:hypothetical protein